MSTDKPLTLLEKKQAKLKAEQEEVAELEAAEARLPEAEKELVTAEADFAKTLLAYQKAHQRASGLRAEIKSCKVTLGIRVQASPKRQPTPKPADQDAGAEG